MAKKVEKEGVAERLIEIVVHVRQKSLTIVPSQIPEHALNESGTLRLLKSGISTMIASGK